jgi:hypothetical protein
MESLVAAYLAKHIDDRIERRRLTGAKDRGDISGLRVHGHRVAVEVKDVAKLALSGWVNEAETARGNDDGLAGVVVHKRRGTADPGDQYVTLTLRDLVALIVGSRP